MGQRGPIASERAIRATGNAGPMPTAPTWLSGEAKRAWKDLAPELHRLGLLTPLDRAAFAVLCQTWSDYQAAERLVHEVGLTFTDKNGELRTHPAVKIANTLASAMLAWLKEFGLTPCSRARLHVETPTADAAGGVCSKPSPILRFLSDQEKRADGSAHGL